MILMPLEKFNQRTTSGINPLEKIYKGKSFKAGPVFSLSSLKASQLYCKKLNSENGVISIIVEEKNLLRIWTEVYAEKQNDYVSSQSIIEEGEISVNSLVVEAEFVKFCKNKLAIYIGPIAQLICKKTLASNPNITRTEFVEILAKKISNPSQALEFKTEMLE